MTLLPIVERELRVASRRRGTFRSRWLMAFGALIVGAGIMTWCDLFSPAGLVSTREAGSFIFWGLAGLSLLYCLLAGRLSTVDSLSVEKREGTLGLLFLTDLRGYDVVLGKLAATSVLAFYGLLAVFPALAVPLLMGGVTSGEFWRVVLVLVNTFMFSLAVGIFASAKARTYKGATGWNFSIMAGFVMIPVFFWMAAEVFFSDPDFFLPVYHFCPIFSLLFGADRFYNFEAWHFWFSVGVFHALTWVFIRRASRIVPYSWQDKTPAEKPRRAVVKPGIKSGDGASRAGGRSRAAFRKKLLNVNATYWLTSRPGNKPAHVWIFVACACLWWLLLCVFFKNELTDEIPGLVTGMLLNAALKLWVTIEAGGWLAHDKKAGAFELLLPTPLPVREMLRGQLLSLRRQFLGPVVFAMVVELLLARACGDWSGLDAARRYWTWGAGIFMLIADFTALTGVAMLDALTARNVSRAPVKTASRVLILPWMAIIVVVATNTFLGRNEPWRMRWHPAWGYFLTVWAGTGLWFDIFFGVRAWRRLLAGFRDLAAGETGAKTTAGVIG